MAVLFWGLKRTRIGCALRGLAESPKAAAMLGINVEGLFRLTSVIAALLGGAAGVLIALYANAVFPLMGQPMLHKGIAVVILGGMGDIRGALLGGFFLDLRRSSQSLTSVRRCAMLSLSVCYSQFYCFGHKVCLVRQFSAVRNKP